MCLGQGILRIYPIDIYNIPFTILIQKYFKTIHASSKKRRKENPSYVSTAIMVLVK